MTVGLAAWIIDHDLTSYEMIARAFDGKSEGLYWENKLAFFAPKNVTIPVAVSVFPDDKYAPPRSWTEKAYPNLIFFNKHDKGGHFAAFEQPAYLMADLRAAFKTLR